MKNDVNKDNNSSALTGFVILLFIVTFGNFLFTMYNGVLAYSYTEWGMIGGMSQEEKRQFHENKALEKARSENAKQVIANTENIRTIIAYACLALGVVSLILSCFGKNKKFNIIFSVFILLLNVMLLL